MTKMIFFKRVPPPVRCAHSTPCRQRLAPRRCNANRALQTAQLGVRCLQRARPGAGGRRDPAADRGRRAHAGAVSVPRGDPEGLPQDLRRAGGGDRPGTGRGRRRRSGPRGDRQETQRRLVGLPGVSGLLREPAAEPHSRGRDPDPAADLAQLPRSRHGAGRQRRREELQRHARRRRLLLGGGGRDRHQDPRRDDGQRQDVHGHRQGDLRQGQGDHRHRDVRHLRRRAGRAAQPDRSQGTRRLPQGGRRRRRPRW